MKIRRFFYYGLYVDKYWEISIDKDVCEIRQGSWGVTNPSKIRKFSNNEKAYNSTF